MQNEKTCKKQITSYQQRASVWTKYEYSYSKVYKAVDWEESGDFYEHKSCKGLFCTLT